MKENTNKKIIPEYIIIPYHVFSSKEISSIDKLVYGAIKMLSSLELGKCIASNKTLGELVGISSNHVTKSLKRLEEIQYIERLYTDGGKKRNRNEIVPLVEIVSKINSKNNNKNDINVNPNGLSASIQTDYRVNPNGLHSIKPSSKGNIKSNNFSFSGENTEEKDVQENDEKTKEKNKQVGELIGSFKTLFPLEFVSKKIFAIPKLRKLVSDSIDVYGFDRLMGLIKDFEQRRFEAYMPTVGGITDFLEYKLVKIEQALKRDDGRTHLVKTFNHEVTPLAERTWEKRHDHFWTMLRMGREDKIEPGFEEEVELVKKELLEKFGYVKKPKN